MVPARYSRSVSSLKVYLFAAAAIIMARVMTRRALLGKRQPDGEH